MLYKRPGVKLIITTKDILHKRTGVKLIITTKDMLHKRHGVKLIITNVKNYLGANENTMDLDRYCFWKY